MTTEKKIQDLNTSQLRELKDKLKAVKINVLLVGGTGVGKSSTINALFQDAGLDGKAMIGQSGKPETMDIIAYELENLVIWDSPGLGDSPEKDIKHREKIAEALHWKDDQSKPLIDLVFLILDAGSRDFSSAYTLIKEVIAPNLGDHDQDRLLVTLNQADNAMKGYGWINDENRPDEELVEWLEQQVVTVKERIKSDTGLDIEPVYYSAGCTINGKRRSEPYNLNKLLSFILDHLPNKKRAVIAMHINEDANNFRINDDKEDYQAKVDKSIFASLSEWVRDIVGDVAGTAGGMIKKVVTDPDNIKWAASTAINLIANLFKKGK
ncbi:MAG: GTPase family protein [Stenotrophomonas sp.]